MVDAEVKEDVDVLPHPAMDLVDRPDIPDIPRLVPFYDTNEEDEDPPVPPPVDPLAPVPFQDNDNPGEPNRRPPNDPFLPVDPVGLPPIVDSVSMPSDRTNIDPGGGLNGTTTSFMMPKNHQQPWNSIITTWIRSLMSLISPNLTK